MEQISATSYWVKAALNKHQPPATEIIRGITFIQSFREVSRHFPTNSLLLCEHLHKTWITNLTFMNECMHTSSFVLFVHCLRTLHYHPSSSHTHHFIFKDHIHSLSFYSNQSSGSISAGEDTVLPTYCPLPFWWLMANTFPEQITHIDSNQHSHTLRG